MVKTRVLTALAMLFVVGGLMFFASHDVWLAAIGVFVNHFPKKVEEVERIYLVET